MIYIFAAYKYIKCLHHWTKSIGNVADKSIKTHALRANLNVYRCIRLAILILTGLSLTFSDTEFLRKESLNATVGGPYTYSQSGHHFYGAAYDGSNIDTYGCCSGPRFLP